MRIFHLALLSAAMLPASAAFAQDIEPFQDWSRLVTIGGSLTEIVYALGAEENLIARDSTSTYPDQALDLPDVGYMRQLAPEGVLSVQPTAILMLEGAGPVETIEVLQDASVPVVSVPETYDAEGVLTKIRTVGAALGLETGELTAGIQERFEAVADIAAQIDDRKSVLFILSVAGGRINAAGTGTAADGILALAGADNAITQYEGYRQLTEEAIIEANPDLILMMDRGGDHAASDEELTSHPAVALTTAGQQRAIVRMNGEYLLGFGPRAADAAADLADAIYGGGN